MNVQLVHSGEQIVLQGKFFIFANKTLCELDFAQIPQAVAAVNDSCYHVVRNTGADEQALAVLDADVAAVA